MIRAKSVDRITLRMHFQKARGIELDPEVIREIIGEEKIKAIKETDPNPMFKAWVAMHEGRAFPQVVGRESKPVNFLASAIKSAYQAVRAALSKGIPAIFGHNEDGREAEKAGNIIAARNMKLDGQESFVVVGHFPPEVSKRVEGVKAISIEGVVDLIDKGRSYIVDLVSSITHFALLENEDPGFPGALEAGVLHAHRGHAIAIYKINARNGENQMTEINLDVPELRRSIRINRIPVDELYDAEDIVGQRREINGKVEWMGGSAAARGIISEYEQKIQKISQDSETRYQELASQSSGLAQKVARYESGPMITEIAKNRKLPQEAMIDLDLERDSFNPDPTKDLRAQSEQFVEAIATKYQKRQEAMKTTPGTTTPAPAKSEPGAATTDYSNPEFNELIPKR